MLIVGAVMVAIMALTFDWLGAVAERYLRPSGPLTATRYEFAAAYLPHMDVHRPARAGRLPSRPEGPGVG